MIIFGWHAGESAAANPHLRVVAPLSMTIGVSVSRKGSYELTSRGVGTVVVVGIERMFSGAGVVAIDALTIFASP